MIIYLLLLTIAQTKLWIFKIESVCFPQDIQVQGTGLAQPHGMISMVLIAQNRLHLAVPYK